MVCYCILSKAGIYSQVFLFPKKTDQALEVLRISAHEKMKVDLLNTRRNLRNVRLQVGNLKIAKQKDWLSTEGWYLSRSAACQHGCGQGTEVHSG